MELPAHYVTIERLRLLINRTDGRTYRVERADSLTMPIDIVAEVSFNPGCCVPAQSLS